MQLLFLLLLLLLQANLGTQFIIATVDTGAVDFCSLMSFLCLMTRTQRPADNKKVMESFFDYNLLS